jgi:hypothetical protein
MLAISFCCFIPLSAQPTVELRPETVQAFDNYVKTVEQELDKRVNGGSRFLWLEEESERHARTRGGEIVIHQWEQAGKAPRGLIHDWIAAMFIPDARVDKVVEVLTNYDGHKDIYPEVIDSKLRKRDENLYLGYLKVLKRKVLTAVLNTEHEARFFRLGDKRWHSRSYSTRIAEVRDSGEPNERELPVGKDSGFLWRLYSYWRLEEVDDGVFVECRALSLTRSVPLGLGWMINPFVRDMPRESLDSTLHATRLAVKQ